MFILYLNMPGRIVYALVSREKTVLAEHTSTTGNFPTITRVLLGRIPPEDGKMSYVYDSHVFHYIVEDGITYLCMADEEFIRRIPFAFLDEVKAKFLDMYGLERAKTAIAFAERRVLARTKGTWTTTTKTQMQTISTSA